MGRGVTVIAAAACLLVVGAQPAAADVIDKRVVKCETTATWQVTRGGTSYADLTFDTSPSTGCKNVHGEVADDMNVLLESYDNALIGGVAYRYSLLGVVVTGAPQFAGLALDGSGRVRGSLEVAGQGLLNANLTGITAGGGTLLEEHLPAGSCGTDCYRVNVILTGVYDS